MGKWGKRGGKYFFPYFFILLKTNTNDAHMQNFIQIPHKMKTGVQNVFKWEKCTLRFLLFTSSRDWKLYTISNIGSEALWGCTLLQRGKMRFGSCAGEVAFPLSLRTPLNVRFYEYQTKKYKKTPNYYFKKESRLPYM